MKDVTISWSVNTLDEAFKNDMDQAVSIERRLNAMKKVYDAGIRTVCFISPVFPGITDVPAIVERVKNQCDFVWIENLNLRGSFKSDVLDFIERKHPELVDLYNEIYARKNRSYFDNLEKWIQDYCREHGNPYEDNYLPDGRMEPGKPMLINYLFHEEVRNSDNKGTRTK
jgi:DNA repair photolyase